MEPLTRFSERAADYAKHRPDYPDAVFEALLDGLKPPITAADVGAGTGISSRALADRGVDVIAVEPNQAMREVADKHAGVRYMDGAGESMPLPDASVDLVTCFQSFHWLEGAKALTEFHRVLKPHGRLALVWNIRDRNDPFTASYSEIVVRYASSPAAEDRPDVAAPLFAEQSFTDLRTLIFPHRQRLNLEGLLGRARSVSYLPKSGPEAVKLIAGLEALFDRWNRSGIVDLIYETFLYRATRG